MSSAKEIQKQFLVKVKAAAPDNISLVDEIADLLETSTDSAYRRLRGETLLSIDEIALICSHFKVAFETNSQSQMEAVQFNYIRIDGKIEHFKKWLKGMCNNVKQIQSVPNSNILYAADDVPIWHHFFDDELIAFKLFYWLKSIVSDANFTDKKFDISLIDDDMINDAKNLLTYYNHVQSSEVWSEDTLNSTIKQVEYFWESGFFESTAHALRICDLISEGVNIVRKKAEQESKLISKGESGEPNFKLYQSEVMIGNNSILVNIGESKIAYVSNNTFNMMSTTTPDFVNENELWLKNLIRKSVLISGVSEKQRNRFFKILQDKISLMRQQIV